MKTVCELRPFTMRPFAKEADYMYIQNNIGNEQYSGNTSEFNIHI